MFNKKSIYKPTATILAAMLITACPATIITDDDVDSEIDNRVIEEDSRLFVEDEDTGKIFFETNDTSYNEKYGFTLWAKDGVNQDPFTELSMTLTKYSGNSSAGYGIVFGAQNNTMLLVLINTKGEYLVGELTDNIFTEIQEWKTNSFLDQGYNQDNTINIVYDSANGDYTVELNGEEACTFRDDDEPYHHSGESGYIAVISPLDNFPEIPVSISYLKN